MPPALHAQEVDELAKELEALLNTKITVASKSAESLNQAPGIVTVVTSRELEGFAAMNLGQVMNRVVGMALLSPDIFKDNSVVIRGQETWPYNNHILVLLNGRPVRDPITGGLNGPIWNAFPLALVERLEIIRGPGSVLYGSCAYSGVVNIVTKAREGDGVSGQITATGGGHGGFGQQGAVAFRSGELTGLVGLNQYGDQGPRFTFTDYEGTLGSGTFDRHVVGAMAEVGYRGFTLRAVRDSYDQFSLNGGSETWDPHYKGQQVATHLDLGYTLELSPKAQIGANVTFNQTDWYTDARTAPTLTTAKATLVELVASLKPREGTNLILGGGAESSTWNGTGLLVGGDQTSTFFYAQVDQRLGAVKLIGGAQYNKLEGIEGNLSPRLGLIWDITPELGAKVLYSTAFRKGYPHETGFNHPVFRGNRDLKPELVTTTEAQLFYQGRTAQASVTLYQSRFKDIITRRVFTTPTFYLQYFNGGSWDYQGVEVEGKVSLSSRFMATGSASYQTNESEAGLKDATLHPNTMVKAGLLYQEGAWQAGVFNAYFGTPKPTTRVSPSSQVVNPEAEAYHLLSAKVSWKARSWGRKALLLTLEGDNLLGTDVRYPDYANKGVNTLLPLHKGASIHFSATWSF